MKRSLQRNSLLSNALGRETLWTGHFTVNFFHVILDRPKDAFYTEVSDSQTYCALILLFSIVAAVREWHCLR
jgi:hypothetical protein